MGRESALCLKGARALPQSEEHGGVFRTPLHGSNRTKTTLSAEFGVRDGKGIGLSGALNAL